MGLFKGFPEGALVVAIEALKGSAPWYLKFPLLLLVASRKEMKGHLKGHKAKITAEEQEQLLHDFYDKLVDIDYEQLQYIKPMLHKIATLVEQNQSLAEGNAISLDEMLEVLGALRDGQTNAHEEMLKAFDTLKTELLEELGLELEEREAIRKYLAVAAFEWKYLDFIWNKYKDMELIGVTSNVARYPIDAGFISVALSGSRGGGVPREAASMLQEYPQLLIEGEAGAGKTTLVQWEAVEHCKRCREIQGDCESATRATAGKALPGRPIIPFFIRLRSLEADSAFPDVGKWLGLSAKNLGATPPVEDWIYTLLRDGRALLLLDGLDELPDAKRPRFWQDLGELFRDYPKLRFRVTTRYFPRDGEKAGQWAPPPLPGGGDTPHVKIQPLEDGRIEQLIDKWHEAVVVSEPTPQRQRERNERLDGYADTLKERLRDEQYRRIRELAQTPFLCAAICLINEANHQVLPTARHELYKTLVEALVGLRDARRGVERDPRYDTLNIPTLLRVHGSLAFDMMSVGLAGNDEDVHLIEADRTEIEQWLEQEHIPTIPKLRKTAAKAPGLLDYLITKCGLLREPTYGRIDFCHRALQEYLAGSSALQRGKGRFLVGKALDSRWHDTIILAAGGLNVGQPESTRLIRDLVEMGLEAAEMQREMEKMYFALAIGCLETAEDLVDHDVEQFALSTLDRLIPPTNSLEATFLVPAGSSAVDALAYASVTTDNPPVEVVSACAETLRRIGSQEAHAQLHRGYIDDERIDVVLELLRSSGVSALAIKRVQGSEVPDGILRVPEFAMEHVRDLKALRECPELHNLMLLDLTDCTLLTGLEPLVALPGLETLHLTGCTRLTSLAPLACLKSLRELHLADCTGLTSLDGLEDLESLEVLDLSRCKGVTDLAPLDGLPKLRKLVLRGCTGLTEVAVLASLEKLDWLDVAYCAGVEDWAVLERLGNLYYLDILGLDGVSLPAVLQGREPVPGQDFIETRYGVNMPMIWVPPGIFTMGSPEDELGRSRHEGPQHEVKLTEGFWIGAVPVTATQYALVTESQGEEAPKAPHRPVMKVSWHKARAYCEKFGEGYNLPAEAQWEYACRAGSAGRFCFGGDDARLAHYAWYNENSGSTACEVGERRPNALGVYDMHGNVLEWCRDWYEGYGPEAQEDPEGPEEGTSRVLRGGAFNFYASFCRSAFRYFNLPDLGNGLIGFRVVRTP